MRLASEQVVAPKASSRLTVPEMMKKKDEALSVKSGRVPGNEYKVKKQIGSGGFANVYLVRHLETGVDRALKVIPKRTTQKKHVTIELRAMLEFSHPYLIKALLQPEVQESDGRHVNYRFHFFVTNFRLFCYSI